MEHRRVYKYKGYDIGILINHQGDLSVGVLKDGAVVDGSHNVGNPYQAEQYIDNIDFEENGILVTQDSGIGYTNVRVNKIMWNSIVTDERIRQKDMVVEGNKAYLLSNSAEHEVLKEITGIDFTSFAVDWFKVYYEE